MMFAPLSLILLVAGVLLVNEVGYSYGDLWITFGFAGFLFSAALGIGYYPRAGKGYTAVAAGDGPGSPAARAIYSRTATVNVIELSVLLLVIIAMTVKPG